MSNEVSQPQASVPVLPTSEGKRFVPPQINNVEDTGLGLLWLQDLALKIFYFQGYQTGFKIAEAMALPFSGTVDQILEGLNGKK